MKEQLRFQKLVRAKYEELRSQNPQFSRRAFSKRLGLSPGAMSEIFNGQRKVSQKLIQKIFARLGVNPQELNIISNEDSIDPMYLQLSMDQFSVISDWHHFAILNLMRTKGFKNDSHWIAKRLGLPHQSASSAIERLMRLGFIVKRKDGRWVRKAPRFKTSDDITNSSVKSAHRQYMQKAKEALDCLSVAERDFTSLMIRMSPEQLPQAKKLIREFQDRFAAEIELKPQTEVFQMLIQLFPLTKGARYE